MSEEVGRMGGSLAEALLGPGMQDFGQPAAFTKADAKALGLKVKKEQPKVQVDLNDRDRQVGQGNAVRAVQAEATAETVDDVERIPFSFDGVDYTVLPTDEWDLEVIEAFEGGVVSVLYGRLLGKDGYAKLKAKKYKKANLERFAFALRDALGIESGE
jgi:hypothetical protein